MSAIRAFLLQCDQPDCDALSSLLGTSKEHAQQNNRERGWYCTRRKDFCPDHAPEHKTADLGITFESKGFTNEEYDAGRKVGDTEPCWTSGCLKTRGHDDGHVFTLFDRCPFHANIWQGSGTQCEFEDGHSGDHLCGTYNVNNDGRIVDKS